MNLKPNQFLNGNYAPIHDELTINGLHVKGKIPKELQGVYMRNGPNPAFPPITYTYPFDGDGMIHAVYLDEGKANYRNRYVETKSLQIERRAGRAVYGGIMNPLRLDPNVISLNGKLIETKNGAFIHIIRHAGRYLAMSESAPAYEMTAQLSTLGEYSPNNNQSVELGPHTRFDPMTGELFLICYNIKPPYLVCHKIDPQGDLVETVSIDKPYATMMHDFLLTQNYIVFIDCPAVLDAEGFSTGGDFLSWQPGLGTRVGVLPRHKAKGMIQWFDIDPFFAFHFANAYEIENKIIIDYVHHENLKFATKAKSIGWPKLYKMMVDLNSKKVINQVMAEEAIEFPRINDAHNSLFNKYIYTPAKPSSFFKNRNKVCPYNSLIKYDAITGKKEVHKFSIDDEVDEAVYAPALNAKSEDDGFIMLFVYNKISDNSRFVVLSAKDFTNEPLAEIELPRRIPHGLHGSWMPGKW